MSNVAPAAVTVHMGGPVQALVVPDVGVARAASAVAGAGSHVVDSVGGTPLSGCVFFPVCEIGRAHV